LKQKRTIVFYGGYFQEFYAEQTAKVKDKIKFVFGIIKTVDRVPEKFLRKYSSQKNYKKNIFN